MTTIKIKKENDYIICVECSNHTGFADYGKDIVCAGVSTLVQTAANSVQKLTDVKNKLVIDENSGYLKLELYDIDISSLGFHDAQVIINSMLCGLEDFQKQYPKYVKLEVK